MEESMIQVSPLRAELPDKSEKYNMNKKSNFTRLNPYVFVDCLLEKLWS